MSLMLFALRRLLGLAATLLVTSFLIFGALYLTPGSPLSYLVGGRTVSPQTVARIKAEYHLDAPFPTRYLSWLDDVLHGRFGVSLVYKESVGGLISPRLGDTLFLLCYAAILIILVGVTAGVAAGLARPRVDGAITALATVGLATPSFIASTVLVTVFAVQVRLFPVFGAGSGFTDRLWHLTLPAVALALSGCAYVTRVTRAAIRQERNREHVETAYSRGLPAHVVIRRHVLRNALAPIATVSGLTIAGLIAGTAVVETAFGLDGVGSLLVQSVSQQDFAVVQAICLILVTAFVLVNTLVDLLYPLIDPRLSLTSGGSR
jgi:peptide/nickel transport system permease protein